MPTSARARQRNRKVLRQVEARVLQAHQVAQLRVRHHQPPSRRLRPRNRQDLRHLNSNQQLLRQRHPRRLQPPLHPSHLWSRDPAQALLLLLQQRRLLQLQVRVHRLWRDHRGRSRRRACHQCIPRPGIMCIFIHRAVSTSIRTCRPIAFSTRLAVSVTRVRQMRCSLPVPTLRLKDGRSCQLTMRNVLWRT